MSPRRRIARALGGYGPVADPPRPASDGDAGTPNLRFSFAAAHKRLLTGGWARAVTVRELPIAKELAGVNVRLKPGGVQELHWHRHAEWAYVLSGRARVTAVDTEELDFVDDVGPDDLWSFPAGISHSIQGLEEGCELLLVFDDGRFSENETFLIDDDAVAAPAGRIPRSFSHRLTAQEPTKVPRGQVRIVDSSNFPAASTIAAALVEIDPGGLRELHTHPSTDEWQYYISGRGRMTVLASGGRVRRIDYRAGDVGYVPCALGHCVENTGDEPLRFLELFRSDRFADASSSRLMALIGARLPAAQRGA